MFRKLLLGAVASLGLLTLCGSAGAHEYRHEYQRHQAYRVYYRNPCRPGWVLAGSCVGHHAAIRFAESFRCRGFETSIR